MLKCCRYLPVYFRSLEGWGALVLPALLLVTLPRTVSGQDASLQEQVLRWFAAADAVWSYEVESDVAWIHKGEVTERIVRRQQYLRGMWRCDVNERVFPGSERLSTKRAVGNEQSFAFNAENFLTLDPDRKFGSQLISNQAMVGFHLESLILPHEITHSNFGSEDYRVILHDRLNAIAESDGEIVLPAQKKHSKITSYATNDILVGFHDNDNPFPRTIRIMGNEGKTTTLIYGVYQQFEQHYFPVEVVRDVFKNVEVVDRRVVKSKLKCLNCEIDPAYFDLSPPFGTIMYDEAEDSNYVRTEKNERDYDAFTEQIVGSRSVPTTRPSVGRIAILIAGVGLIAIWVLLFVHRTNRKC